MEANLPIPFKVCLLALTGMAWAALATCRAQPRAAADWKTDWGKRSVDLEEIISGGVPRDGIPPIDAPRFVPVSGATGWVSDREPVILLAIGDDARAYPLQIMTYHEIVNDVVGGEPVSVTFCPLCYSAIAYHRRLGDVVYDFGVSGMLRHSDLIMYDRQTESLWQQIGGEAIVGEMTGARLVEVPAQIVSFGQFADRFPDGRVLSRDTGHSRRYGTNPYRGYDDIEDRPFLFRGEADGRLPPMEKVVSVSIGNDHVAYPHSTTRAVRVINDEVAGEPVLILHVDGAVTALGDAAIRESRMIGTTGVFDRRLDGRELRFRFEEGNVRDLETRSAWDATGRAVAGPLAGKVLRPVAHGNPFAFAWFAFRPDSRVFDLPVPR